jgi:hypothetical protein
MRRVSSDSVPLTHMTGSRPAMIVITVMSFGARSECGLI